MMPGVLAGVFAVYQGKMWKALYLLLLFTSQHLLANHLQMTYYLLILIGAVVVALGVEAWRKKELKRFLKVSAFLAAAGAVSALPNALNILNTQEYAKFTTRGKSILEYETGPNGKSLMASDGTVLNLEELGGKGSGENSGEGLGTRYILEYSMSKMEWLAVMCPDFKGGATRVPVDFRNQVIDVPVYWGEQKYSAGAFYFGVLIMLFFFAFLIFSKHWLRWPFALIALISVVLSWRDESMVMRLFLDYVPMFNKFRDTKMMLVLLQTMAGIGAVLMLVQWTHWGKERVAKTVDPNTIKRRNLQVAGFFGGFLLLFGFFYVFPTAFLSFSPELRTDPLVGALDDQTIMKLRLDVFRSDVLRTLGLIVLAGLAAASLLWGKVKAHYVAMAVLAIQTIDLWNVNFRYHSNELPVNGGTSWIQEVDYNYPYRPLNAHLKILNAERSESEAFNKTQEAILAYSIEKFPRKLRPADRELLETLADFEALRAEGAPFRVLHFVSPYTDAETSYFFQSIGGYHGAKLQRYQDFMEIMLADELLLLSQSAQRNALDEGLQEMWGHRMLNTKYILVTDETVIPFPNPAGVAWFVKDIKWAETSNDEALYTRSLKTLDRAVIPRDYQEGVEYMGDPGEHTINLIQHDPEYIQYEVESENGGVMVCSEVHYPRGWKATIDGEPTRILRANFLFRALSIPPGKHRVEMRFESVTTSKEMFSNIGGIASLIFLFISIAMSFREPGKWLS